MKKKLIRNIGLKILSVLLAALLWLVITNVDDPVVSKPFSNVSVKILNEEVIDTPNQVYEIIEGETIDFRVAARRSIIDNLTVADFNVVADFAHLSNVNSVVIDITPKRNKSEIVVTDGKYQSMIISLEELSEEDFKVNVVQKGEVTDGYYVGEKTASPNIIRVSGPKRRIEKIKEVVVEVDVTGASQSASKILKPKVLDEEGKEIDATRLEFSDEYIEVNLGLFPTKEVDFKVNVTGEPAEGYIVTNVGYEPKKITIAGKENVIKNISYLQVDEDISGETKDIEKDINLQEHLKDKLPEGVVVVGEDLNASVKITIEKLETKEITIWPNDIELKNKQDNLSAIFNTTGPIKVNIKGPENEIADLTRKTLQTYIELTDYTIGTYAFTLNAELPQHVSLFDTPMVSISLAP